MTHACMDLNKYVSEDDDAVSEEGRRAEQHQHRIIDRAVCCTYIRPIREYHITRVQRRASYDGLWICGLYARWCGLNIVWRSGED